MCALYIYCIQITKCFIGAASFELPRAFEQAGVVGSVVGILFLAITSSFSLQRLAACSKLLPPQGRQNGENLTYPVLGRCAFGWWGWFISWFGVMAMTLGVCGSYFVFIASTMSSMTSYSQTEWLLLTMVTVIILSWMRHLSHLAFTSAFGIAALVMAVSVTCFDASKQHTHKGINDLPMFELDTYPLFLGNAGFLYLISTAVLPLAQNMDTTKNAESKYSNLIPDGHHSPYGSGIDPSFSNAFNSSVLFVTVLNLAFGLYAWKQYGECHGDDDDECVQSNVIDNLGDGNLAIWVKVLLCVDLLFTSLVFLFPVNEIIEQEYFGPEVISRLTSRASMLPSSSSSYSLSCPLVSLFGDLSSSLEWKRNASRTLLAMAVAGIAYLVPSFSLLTGLTGGFGNNILGFILPVYKLGYLYLSIYLYLHRSIYHLCSVVPQIQCIAPKFTIFFFTLRVTCFI
jgi:hypothetical protein